MRLDRYHAVPSFVVSLRHPILFIAAYEVCVDTRSHCGPKFVEDSANLGDIAGIGGWLRPVRQQIQDERRAAIAECGLVSGDPTRRFLNASSTREIIFVRGATEGINLVAQAWGRRNVREGDEIVITWLEHHANIVPWQMLCSEKGARLRVAPVNDRGEIILDGYENLLGPRTKIVSFSQVSNALGTITPAREMVEMAHRYGARVLVDGAQAVSHMPVDVQTLDCDFYVFSGHKVFGPRESA